MNSNDDASFSSFRSPLLMNGDDTAILIIDAQEKLMPLIQNHNEIQTNIIKLLRAAKALGVTTAATEQYPRGLGTTVEPIRNELEPSEFFPDRRKDNVQLPRVRRLTHKTIKIRNPEFTALRDRNPYLHCTISNGFNVTWISDLYLRRCSRISKHSRPPTRH